MQTLKTFLFIAITVSLTSFVQAQQFNSKRDGLFAESKTFKVNGNCGMCTHRIETAIKNQPGVWSVDWSVESKSVLVKYDRTITSVNKLQQLVADAGHDTEKFIANVEVYNRLPECCHYQRMIYSN